MLIFAARLVSMCKIKNDFFLKSEVSKDDWQKKQNYNNSHDLLAAIYEYGL